MQLRNKTAASPKLYYPSGVQAMLSLCCCMCECRYPDSVLMCKLHEDWALSSKKVPNK